jgi:dinuclear metal center YbgI/SA1388 family protein
MVTVGDIVRIIETIADPYLAEEWDNCGLQVGHKDHPVKKIVTALDPLPSVVDYACSVKADLLVTHHPLIFRAIKSLDSSKYPGNVITKAVKNSLSIYAAHTSLDSAKGGLNDVFAERMGLKKTRVLGRMAGEPFVKLVIFTPLDHRERILTSLSETTAGIIGDYTCCSFSSSGQGRFKPGDISEPYSGIPGEIDTIDEFRIESLVKKNDVANVVQHVRKVHPYEVMAYDVYPLTGTEHSEGLGRIGEFDHPVGLDDFVRQIKERFGVDRIRIAGRRDIMIGCVALCTGSGSSMIKDFLNSSADVFVSGDLSYHDARHVEDAGKTLVDVGHFASEIIMADAIGDKIDKACKERGIPMLVDVCRLEKDPFEFI